MCCLCEGRLFNLCYVCSDAGNITSRLAHRLLWIAFAIHRLHIHNRKVRLGQAPITLHSLRVGSQAFAHAIGLGGWRSREMQRVFCPLLITVGMH